MTTIDIYEPVAVAGRRHPALLAGLKRLWAALQNRRRRHRALVELSQLDARLLRDIGIEPMDLADALARRRYSVWLDPIRRRANG